MSSQRNVFANSSEHIHGTVHTGEIVDIVVEFTNITEDMIHLHSLSLVNPGKYVRLIGTSVYDSRRLGYFPAENVGDLPRECPDEYVPSATGSLIVKPRQSSSWFGVLAIRIMKPGRYTIRRVRVAFSANNHPGWQYQNSNMTLNVHNPPLTGPRPIPPSQVC